MWLFTLQKTVNRGLKDGFLQAVLPCFAKTWCIKMEQTGA